VVELVLACLARNSSTHFCALPVLLWKKRLRTRRQCSGVGPCMSSSELLYSLLCPPCTPVEEATEDSQTVQRSWSLHVQLGTPLLTAVQLKIDSTSTSPKRSPSSTASPKRSPPSPRKKIRILLLPSFPFYILVNHIAEYVSLIFSNVESFAHKAPVAFNCRFEI
jgi:hypothetical protein